MALSASAARRLIAGLDRAIAEVDDPTEAEWLRSFAEMVTCAQFASGGLARLAEIGVGTRPPPGGPESLIGPPGSLS